MNTTWCKSTFSNGQGDCAEARVSPAGNVQIRDSERPDEDLLTFTRSQWDAFVAGVKAGEFDL